jgi:hypothetical protein
MGEACKLGIRKPPHKKSAELDRIKTLVLMPEKSAPLSQVAGGLRLMYRRCGQEITYETA